MEIIFECFTSPAHGKYAWIGQDEKEVSYLNDFRHSNKIIAWGELLNLLEGATYKLSRPKNVPKTDLEIPRSNTIPIFGKSIEPIEFHGHRSLGKAK